MTPNTTELILVNVRIADALLKAGIPLIEQGRIVDGNRCFVFEYAPHQGPIVRKLVYGR